MELEYAVYKYLSEYPALTALISTKIYPSLIPQSTTLPAISYSKHTTKYLYDLTAATDLRVDQMQFNIFSTTLSNVLEIYVALKAALDYYAGTVTYDGNSIFIQRTIFMNTFTDYDMERLIHSRKCEVKFLYKET